MSDALSDDLGAYTERLPAYTERPTLSYKDMDTENLDWLDWRAKDVEMQSELHFHTGILHFHVRRIITARICTNRAFPQIPANQNLPGTLQLSITDNSC